MQSYVVAGSVVVGVDGSADAERAVAWAAREAVLERRRLLILHSCHEAAIRDTAWLDAQGIDHKELRNALEAAARAIIDRAVDRARLAAPGLEVDALLVSTDARTALVHASERAELVVVGSRGHGPIGSLLLGSVSTSVARHAQCPVVVCRPPTTPAVRRGVVVAADGSEASRPVLEFAFRQASLRGLPLTVVPHFWDATPQTSAAANDAAPGAALTLRARLAESVTVLQEKFTDVAVQLQLTRGLVDECLTGSMPPADLVVIGRLDGHEWTRFLQASCAVAVLERANSTVAVVPEGATPSAASVKTTAHHEERNRS